MRVADAGNGLVVPDHSQVQPRVLDSLRERAAKLEGDSHTWQGSNKQGTGKKPVRIKMPSGQVIEVGGECLVQALASGGVPV